MVKKKKKGGRKKITNEQARDLIFEFSQSFTTLSRMGSNAITGKIDEIFEALKLVTRKELLIKKLRWAYGKIGSSSPAKKIRFGTKGNWLNRIYKKGEKPILEIDGDGVTVREAYNLKGKTRRTGGVKEVSGVVLSDGSVEFAMAGTIEESISVVRRSDKTKMVNKGALDYSKKLDRASKLHYGEENLKGYDRAHLWGHGFGDEAMDGIMYLPSDLNRKLQNAILEDDIRGIAEKVRQRGGKVVLTAVARSHPPLSNAKGLKKMNRKKGEHLLRSLQYKVEIELPGGERKLFASYGIEVDPPPLKLGKGGEAPFKRFLDDENLAFLSE